MTVSSMLNSMSQKELNYWMAYFRIENEEYDKESTKKETIDENGYKVVTEEEQAVRDTSLVNQLMKFAVPANKSSG